MTIEYLCDQCGEAKVVRPKRFCLACAKSRQRQYELASRDRRRSKLGLPPYGRRPKRCLDCGGEKNPKGIRCRACAAKRRLESVRAARRRRGFQQLGAACWRCRQHPARHPRARYCQYCKDGVARDKRENWMAAGLRWREAHPEENREVSRRAGIKYKLKKQALKEIA